MVLNGYRFTIKQTIVIFTPVVLIRATGHTRQDEQRKQLLGLGK